MFKRFSRGLARMLTIPRAIRNRVNANPIDNAIKDALLADAQAAIEQAVDRNILNPVANQAIKDELGHVLAATGIAK